jgi:crossover junction endodeoxyribonuclease RusA
MPKIPGEAQGRAQGEGAVIELPFPAKILWPNGRGHYMAKHREFQKHKTWAFLAAKSVHPDMERWAGGKLQWSATFYPKTRHIIDKDNAAASLKAYQDGIAAAMMVNDNLFDTPTIHFAEPVKNGRVVITLLPGAEAA